MESRVKNVLVFIYGAAFTLALCMGTFEPLLPIFAKRIGASYFDLGVIGAAYNIPFLVLPMVVGFLSDRYGKKNFLLVGMFFFTLTVGVLVLATNVQEVIIVRFLSGVSTCFIYTPLIAIVASASTSEGRIKAFGRNASSWTLGNLIGPVIGGTILVNSDFLTLFLSSTAIGVTSFLISIYGLKGFEVCFKKKMLKRDSYSQTIRSRIAIFLITLANYSTMGVMLYLFPAFVSDLGMTSFQVGLLFAILGLARMSGSMASDNISKIGIKRSMGLGFLVMTATLAYIPYLYSLEGFALAMALTGFALGILSPQIYSIVSEMYPDESIGSAIGYVETFLGIGFALGPFIGGLAAETIGTSSPYFIVSIISGLALIPIILLKK